MESKPGEATGVVYCNEGSKAWIFWLMAAVMVVGALLSVALAI